MKRYRVLWTKQAASDLEETVDFIKQDNQKAAWSLYQKIIEKSALLKSNPEKYRSIPELAEIGVFRYRELVIRPYRILFRIAESIVYVFAVVDSRRDFETFLFRRFIREDGEPDRS